MAKTCNTLKEVATAVETSIGSKVPGVTQPAVNVALPDHITADTYRQVLEFTDNMHAGAIEGAARGAMPGKPLTANIDLQVVGGDGNPIGPLHRATVRGGTNPKSNQPWTTVSMATTSPVLDESVKTLLAALRASNS